MPIQHSMGDVAPRLRGHATIDVVELAIAVQYPLKEREADLVL